MSKALATKNVAAVLLAVVMAFGFTFAFTTPVKADVLSDLQAQVQALLAQIAALQGSSSSSTTTCTAFTRNHQQNDTGGEVMAIQKFLNSNGAQIAATGAGSPGNETSFFGGLTKAAVAKFQAANGIAPAAGYWGPITRAKANTMCSGAGVPGVPGVPVTGNGLKVMLATDNPAFGALVQGQATGELAKYTFVNPTSASIMVTNLAFKRIGVSTDTAVDNVYLFQGATRLTDPAGISNSSFSFTNSSGIFTLLPGGSVTISVKADIDSAANGQQVGVQLTGVTASGALDGSVVLPISGSTFTISSASIATGAFGTVTPTGATFAPANETTVFQSTLTVGNRAVLLKSIQFENRGSSGDADFMNLKLMVKGTQVGSTVAKTVNDKVVFDLSAAPVRLETGGSEIRLVADIVGGSGETFDFQIRRAIDAQIVDTDLNQPLVPTGSLSAAAANNIEGVGLSVTKANTSPSANVAVDSTNVLWGRFEFRATGDNLKIEQITVDADNTYNSGLDNGKVFFNGVQVGSTQDIADGGTTFSLGSQMILTAGATGIVEIYADAKTATSTSFASGNTVDVGVSVATADTEGVNSGDRLTSAISEVEGNSITVTSSTLTGTKASGYGNQTIVAGTNNAKIGSFTLSTGSTEGVNVNTITINLSSTEAASITDLRLVDNATGVQIGSTKSSASTDNVFSVNVPMGVSVTKTVNVIANVKSSAGAGTIIADVDITTGGTGSITGSSVTIGGSDVSLQTITIGSGTLTVTRDPGTPVNANVIAGSNMVSVGRFDFAAANSSYTVEEVKVKIPADAATSVSNVTLKYKNAAGVEQTVSQALALSSGAQTHATATFTGLSMHVPLNDSADIEVFVDVPTISSGANSGAAISVSLDAGEGFKAVDGAGTQDTSLATSDIGSTDATGYGTKYVKKSIPTLARLSTGYTANTVASGVGLYRFTVTADLAGSVEWRELSFTVATVTASLTDVQLYDVTGTAVQVGATVASTGSNLVFCPGTSCTIGEAEQIGAGASKTYEIRATVTDWGTAGDSVTISFAADTSAIVNAVASGLHAGQNMVWSDRASNSHTTATADWTNGYLVKDTDNDTRSCQFGSSTTCTP